MKRGSFLFAMGLLASATAMVAAPTPAEACGGTFCDAGPTPMPVDQSGENILFVRDGNFIEAHIQIQYEGEAEQFGWVIPLQSLPEFSVGSEPMFQALLGGTVPSYFAPQQFDQCNNPGNSGGADPGDGAGGTGAAGDDGGGDETGGEGGGPEIVLMENVGAYEITVLSGGTAAEVMTWLDENGYEQDPEAEPILQAYLDEGHLFGAVKLTGGADVDEIHPIVLRFESSEPCIPLRLTRIAAVDDMEVRSFFLGESRTVPQNYKHVLVNQVKIDWTPGSIASNYKDIITQAVDAPEASGRAFVTEYAGGSDVVPTGGFYAPQWDASPFVDMAPIGVVDELQAQGLYFCDFDFQCFGQHPLVQPILDEFLPVPEGVDPASFYSCLSCFEEQIDLEAWDGQGFSDAVQDRIVGPGLHAVELFDKNPYLTRMYTTISPGEMTTDPMFHENSELDDVPNNQVGTQRILCNGDSVYILPDGRQVYVPQGEPWPDFDNEPAWSMPSDEEVQEVMTAGAPVVLANHTVAIDEALDAYNLAQGWNAPEGGSGGSDGSGSSSGGADDDSSGCGCQTQGNTMPGMLAMFLGLGLGLASRRRRRSA